MKWYIKIAVGVIAAYAVAEIYRQLATPEQKRRWEGLVKTHHGEAGLGAVAGGAVARSPALAGIGIGLALHDIKDASKWFRRR